MVLGKHKKLALSRVCAIVIEGEVIMKYLKIILVFSLIMLPLICFSRELSAEEPADAKALAQEALSLQNKGNYEASVAKWQEVIKADRNYYSAYFYIGENYFKQERYTEAIESLNKLINVSPVNYPALTYRARSYLQLEQYDEAIADLNLVTRFVSYAAAPFYYRAKAYFYKGDYEKAWEDIYKVKDILESPSTLEDKIERDPTLAALKLEDGMENDFIKNLNSAMQDPKGKVEVTEEDEQDAITAGGFVEEEKMPDIIHLKNGQKIEGRIRSETDTEIIIKTGIGQITYPKDKISSIEHRDIEE